MRRNYAIVCVLFGFLIACGGGEPPAEEVVPATEPAGGTGDLEGLLPEADAVSGWALDGEPRFFSADNLWEFINGAAEGYLLYGFEEVITSDFANEESGQSAVIDIYRMQDPLHAFGIYCQERNPDYQFLDIGGGGYLTGTALNFWQGPYYVKMTVFEESDELKAALQNLADAVSSKIAYPSTEPAEVNLLPTENQKPYTVQFLPRDVLGQSYLSNAFEAQYEAEGKEYKIVIVMTDGPDAAKEDLAKYREFLSRAETQDLEGLGDGGFIGEDSFYGKVLAVSAGDDMVVVLGPPSEDLGKSVLEQVLSNLQSAA
jgi:hypothetical protein